MTRPIVVMCVMLAPLLGHAAEEGSAALCAQARDDDTVRRYDPSLRAGLLRAYAHLFPQARMPPNEQDFQVGAHFRCMDGRLWACFTGANLPCAKMNTAHDNKGAEAAKIDLDAPFVSAFATGHDHRLLLSCDRGFWSSPARRFAPDDERIRSPGHSGCGAPGAPCMHVCDGHKQTVLSEPGAADSGAQRAWLSASGSPHERLLSGY